MSKMFFVDELESYRRQAREAVRLFSDACQRQKQAQQDMSKFRYLAFANANMLPDDERRQIVEEIESSGAVGFTDTIRQLYRDSAPKPLTAMQIRGKLAEAGFDLSGQSNALASIHSVIRRLATAGYITPHGDPDVGGYRWKGLPSNHPLQKLRANPNRFDSRYNRSKFEK
jgi:hypothetical protein